MKKKFPAVFIGFMSALLLTSAFSSVMLYRYNNCLGVIGMVCTAVLLIAMAVILILSTRSTIRHISKMNTHLENSAAEYMNSSPAPIAVIDNHRQFVWYNQMFAENISRGDDLYGLVFSDYVKIDLDSLEQEGECYCHIKGTVYKVHAERFEQNDISFLIILFQDETAYYSLKKASDDSHPNVVILTIDNYDEIMQNAKESEKALASVETEQLIELFGQAQEGDHPLQGSKGTCGDFGV